jgi:hypothetical protein
MSQPPPPDDASPTPPDARPGDTWSLDPPPPAAAGLPPAPGEGSLPLVHAELTDPGGPVPPVTPPRRGLKVAGILVAAILIVAGAAGAAAFLMLRGSGEVILDKVPADADVVVTAYLDPAASQKLNLFRMASRFPELGDQEHLRQQVNDALDSTLSQLQMDHTDVSWVGSEVGLSVEVKSPDDVRIAFLIAADDEDAARASLQKFQKGLENLGSTFRTSDHDGVEVTVPSDPSEPAFAIVDGVVVIGSSEVAVDTAIDTSQGGDTIADDAGFQRVAGELPQAKLGMAFVDAAHLADTFGDQLAAAGVTTGVTSISALDGIGVSLSAEPDGLAMDTVMLYDDAKLTEGQRATLTAPDHPNPLLDLIPADALAMYAVEHLDMSIQDSIDQITRTTPGAAQQLERMGVTGPDGLLSQLTGDVAVEATAEPGPTGYGGALMVGTNDPSATQAWLDRTLQQLPLGTSTVKVKPNGDYGIVQQPVRWTTEDHAGVTITYASGGAELPVAYAVVGDVAVVATTPRQIERLIDTEASGSTISSDPGFTSATTNVPTSDGVLYVDVPAIVDSIRQRLPAEMAADFDRQVGKNLAPIEAVVAGSENTADEQRIRLLVRIP